jgi:patatin-related protein
MSATTTKPRGVAWAQDLEEVRLAMGWNGGVSLAVWMGGVAVELDEARRTVPGTPATPAKAGSTAALYQALVNAFHRRLVIDILAGASAGGLNGALLAGVITHGKELTVEFMRKEWLEIGDFGRLLKPLNESKPTSVMKGNLFHEKLSEAFVTLLGKREPPEPDVEGEPLPVLLDVQVTNVLGHEKRFVDDWGLTFRALEHRAPVQFRDWTHFDAETLATAARASASFPGAFEPLEISDSQMGSLVVPHTTWAVDGGLLENAPIRQAIELIPQRSASGPVKRYVCYVNAAPTGPQDLKQIPEPDLRKVISYAINLPRTGRVVDQLYALEDATRRAGMTSSIGVDLIRRLPSDHLFEVASGLLPAYQRRRGALSLEELLAVRGAGGPGNARKVIEQLAIDANSPDDLAAGAALLPWIPAAESDIRNAGSVGTDWRFGVRAAQRIIQLELDLLRAELLESQSPDAAGAIFSARGEMDDSFNELEGVRVQFLDPKASPEQAENLTKPQQQIRKDALDALGRDARSTGSRARESVEVATRSFYNAMRHIAPDRARALFGPLPSKDPSKGQDLELSKPLPDELSSTAFRAFVARALAVEVVRRSFSDDLDIESTQTLHVAQLTPLTESPLFDRGHPEGPTKWPDDAAGVPPTKNPALGPTDTKEKLAGVRLGHFAGFYRRSWRSNDFMWGRLDGAAMIARLLIDSERAAARQEVPGVSEKPWELLANALLAEEDGAAEANADRRALIEEHLGRQKDLGSALRDALKTDLITGDGELTRSIVARALQFQILREELPELADSAEKDRIAGARPSSIRKWASGGSLNETIALLRKGRGKQSLPALLGCDDRDEATSQLALRTLSHALLVMTSAVGGVLPLGRALQPVRVPLLSVQGVSAKRPLDRIATALAITGAAWYATARLLALIQGVNDPSRISPGGKVPINALWTSPVLAYITAVLAVIGFAAVPTLRAFRSRRPKRIAIEGTLAGAILCAGWLVLFIEAIRTSGMSEALTTWSAPDFAPNTILALAAAAGGLQLATAATPWLRAVALVQGFIRRFLALTSAIYAAIAIVLAVYAAKHGLPHTWPKETWPRVAVVLAAAMPVLTLCYVRSWDGWNRKGD